MRCVNVLKHAYVFVCMMFHEVFYSYVSIYVCVYSCVLSRVCVLLNVVYVFYRLHACVFD